MVAGLGHLNIWISFLCFCHPKPLNQPLHCVFGIRVYPFFSEWFWMAIIGQFRWLLELPKIVKNAIREQNR